MNLKLKLCTLLCLGFGSLFTPPNIQAELLKTENFEYEANSLNTLPAEAGWIQATAKTVTENIDLVEQPLSYSGYHETAVGKAVHINPEYATATTQGFALKATDNGITSGTVYTSFLLKVNSISNATGNMVFTFAGANKDGFTANNTNLSQHGRLLIAKGSTDTKFKIKTSKNSTATKCTTLEEEYDLGTTYLVVMSYEFVDGAKNDIFSLWINPATDGTQPDAIHSEYDTAGDVSDKFGIQGVRVYQYKSVAPDAVIDAIKVATSWADLFPNDDPQPTAKLEVTPTAIDFADGMAVLQGESVSKTIVVKGTGLTGSYPYFQGRSRYA